MQRPAQRLDDTEDYEAGSGDSDFSDLWKESNAKKAPPVSRPRRERAAAVKYFEEEEEEEDEDWLIS